MSGVDLLHGVEAHLLVGLPDFVDVVNPHELDGGVFVVFSLFIAFPTDFVADGRGKRTEVANHAGGLVFRGVVAA